MRASTVRLAGILGLPLLAVIVSLPAGGAPPAASEMLAAYPHPKGYVAPRANGIVTIDGVPDEAAWAIAPWSDAFEDIEGNKQPKPRYRTRMKMLWDDKALYIAAELDDPHVWGHLTEHDAVIFADNDFEVFIDPDGDSQNYGEMEMNARNTTWDLLLTKPYKDGGRAINAWEVTGMRTAVKVNGTINDPRDTDKGWTLEIKWPWAGLKELSGVTMPPKDGDQWRINFSRVEWDILIENGKYVKVKNKPENNWVWSPQGVIDMHRPERWGYVQFTSVRDGKAEFVKDPDWAVKDELHRAYYAQRDIRAKTGKYAAKTEDLGLKGAGPFTVETGRNVFEMSRPVTEGGKTTRAWFINQDARLWRE